MYQVSGLPCAIITLKLPPSAQYGQRVTEGLLSCAGSGPVTSQFTKDCFPSGRTQLEQTGNGVSQTSSSSAVKNLTIRDSMADPQVGRCRMIGGSRSSALRKSFRAFKRSLSVVIG